MIKAVFAGVIGGIIANHFHDGIKSIKEKNLQTKINNDGGTFVPPDKIPLNEVATTTKRTRTTPVVDPVLETPKCNLSLNVA